jgi:hypothetical protein
VRREGPERRDELVDRGRHLLLFGAHALQFLAQRLDLGLPTVRRSW